MELSKELAEMAKEPVKIPNWTKGATMEIKLGKRNIFFPAKGENGLLEIKKIKAYITCRIDENGCLDFGLDSWLMYKIVQGFLSAAALSFICACTCMAFHCDSNVVALLLTFFVVLLTVGIVISGSDYKISAEEEFKNITISVLFRQFREEILGQVVKCLPLAKAKQETFMEFLKETAVDNAATLAAIERVRKDMEAGLERVRRDLGTARSLDLQDPTENPSAPFLSPKTEILEN